jgi:hypothetical protein
LESTGSIRAATTAIRQWRFNHARPEDDIAAVDRLIRLSPVGTTVLTYNSFGGRMPECCDLLHLEWALPGPLRLWRKQRDTPTPGAARGIALSSEVTSLRTNDPNVESSVNNQ